MQAINTPQTQQQTNTHTLQTTRHMCRYNKEGTETKKHNTTPEETTICIQQHKHITNRKPIKQTQNKIHRQLHTYMHETPHQTKTHTKNTLDVSISIKKNQQQQKHTQTIIKQNARQPPKHEAGNNNNLTKSTTYNNNNKST